MQRPHATTTYFRVTMQLVRAAGKVLLHTPHNHKPKKEKKTKTVFKTTPIIKRNHSAQFI